MRHQGTVKPAVGCLLVVTVKSRLLIRIAGSLRPKEQLGIFATAVLLLLLLAGFQEDFWTLANLLQYGPYFIIAAILGILAWSFKDRVEGRREEPTGPFLTTVERLPVTRTERVSLWAYSLPGLLLVGAGELLYEDVTNWDTVVGYVCDRRTCGYTPVLTFGNAVLVLFFSLAIVLVVRALTWSIGIRNERKKQRQL